MSVFCRSRGAVPPAAREDLNAIDNGLFQQPEPPDLPAGEETLPPGSKAVVVRSGLNQVRSEPSMRGEILTILPVNRAVTALGRNRFTTWIKVELADGSSGWIGAFYVTADYDLALLPEIKE